MNDLMLNLNRGVYQGRRKGLKTSSALLPILPLLLNPSPRYSIKGIRGLNPQKILKILIIHFAIGEF
jgi:hypothetical protein